MIDAATPNHPVLVQRFDRSMFLANSLALKLAGITETTPVPANGEIAKDASGRLTGILKGSAADLVRIAASFKDRHNATVVLMIEPGALEWSDLPTVQRLVAAAEENFIDLSAVTPDGVAGTLATASGIPTATLPMGVVAADPRLPATT